MGSKRPQRRTEDCLHMLPAWNEETEVSVKEVQCSAVALLMVMDDRHTLGKAGRSRSSLVPDLSLQQFNVLDEDRPFALHDQVKADQVRTLA